MSHGVLALPSAAGNDPPDGAANSDWTSSVTTAPAGGGTVRDGNAGQPTGEGTAGLAVITGVVMASGATASGVTMTRIGFDSTHPFRLDASSIGKPSRIILDLPEVGFQLPQGAGRQGTGLITGFRFGLLESGKSRIVLDTREPTHIERAAVVGPYPGGAWRLEVDLTPASPAEAMAQELAEAARTIEQPPDTPSPREAGRPAHRPLIVVDAGHGGIDSGAEGALNLEKHVVLEVARRVGEALRTSGRYDVIMTRDRDVFVSLDRRLRISQEHSADLFLSIHADSVSNRAYADNIRGATVYTLGERASDELARRMAEKENAVDLLAGLPVSDVSNDQVRSILIDLMRRESANFSSDFRNLLISKLKSSIVLGREPFRSAPFKVLRQAGSPAVLIELGYMSNPGDEKLMSTASWQAKVAIAIRAAVDEHFRHRRAQAR